ncbi:nitrogen regulatory protein P-II [Spirochaetia bacterium]|nr:nitrogen regulatory protein P-II [Spirochaetia bacterium]
MSNIPTTITAADDNIRLKALMLIVDWAKVHAVSDVFANEDCLLSFVSKGEGTASSDIIDLLGIGATDKAVFLSLVQSTETPRIIQTVRKVMGAGSVGAGIAFSIPLRQASARIYSMFEQAAREAAATSEGAQNKTSSEEARTMRGIEIKNEMIVSILNRGNSDAFMTEARKAGARGGTVISARGISQNVIKKFFKMSVQDEKEIIFILADKEQSLTIMNAVKTDFGAESKAGGVIFSLPVDQVMSLNALS